MKANGSNASLMPKKNGFTEGELRSGVAPLHKGSSSLSLPQGLSSMHCSSLFSFNLKTLNVLRLFFCLMDFDTLRYFLNLNFPR